MGIQSTTIGIGVLILSAGLWTSQARGDGGTLRAWDRQGGYEIAVFTSPTPFVAGPVDISVLVLDADSGSPIPGLTVDVTLTPVGRPGGPSHHAATPGASTNALFYAAVFDLDEPGTWAVDVSIEGSRPTAKARFELEATGPPPRWWAFWPWVAWPVIPVAFYGVHQRLVWRKTHSRQSV